MASNSRHLKRHSMPTAWPVQRKTIPFVSKPNPGSHKREYVISALILLRDVLKVARNSKEAKYIINNQDFLVNGNQVTDIKQPIGLFDVVDIPLTKQKFTILFNEFGRVALKDTKEDVNILKVTGKKQVTGGKLQVNLMNGYNIFVDEKTFKKINVGDSLEYDFKNNTVKSTLPLAAKSYVYVFDGKFQGQIGEVEEFITYNGLTKDAVKLKIGEESQRTIKNYCYVIGTKKEDVKRFE